MKRYFARVRRQTMVFVAAVLMTNGIVLPVSSSFAASTSVCRSYARDYARRYAAMLPRTTSHSLLKSSLFDRAFEHCMRNEWP